MCQIGKEASADGSPVEDTGRQRPWKMDVQIPFNIEMQKSGSYTENHATAVQLSSVQVVRYERAFSVRNIECTK